MYKLMRGRDCGWDSGRLRAEGVKREELNSQGGAGDHQSCGNILEVDGLAERGTL